MADYIRPTATTTRYTAASSLVVNLTRDYGGSGGQEGALLNGLLAMGYDPAIVRSFADADPNRRFLNDAVTRALRAGVSQADIEKALRATRAAATGDPQGAIRALGVDPNNLPPESRSAFDAIANRQPLPFLDRGQTQPAGWSDTGRPMEQQRSGTGGPPKPAAPPPGQAPQQQAAGMPRGTGLPRSNVNAPSASSGIVNLPKLRPNAPPEEIEAYIRKHYGHAAWALSVPELRDIVLGLGSEFGRAGVIDIPESVVEGRLSGTEWWKTHSGPQRLAIEEKLSDPAQYNAKVEGKFAELGVIMGQVGFTVPEGRLRQIAASAYDMGWNQAEMRAALAAEFDYNPETGEEDSSRIVADLRAQASDYLVPLSEGTIDQWGRQLIAGTSTAEDFTAYTKNVAKGLFAHYATDIDAGRTVKQIADPFVEMAARDLEMTADQIDLMDPKWRKALELDPETGQPMQPSKWQRLLRSDSSYGWDRTQNAKAEASEFARKIAESFGQ